MLGGTETERHMRARRVTQARGAEYHDPPGLRIGHQNLAQGLALDGAEPVQHPLRHVGDPPEIALRGPRLPEAEETDLAGLVRHPHQAAQMPAQARHVQRGAEMDARICMQQVGRSIPAIQKSPGQSRIR